MWNVSSDAADLLFSLSNIILIAGAAAVLIGTIGSIQMASVREFFADHRLSDNERAIADANARTKEAELKLAQLRKLSGPRDVDADAFRAALVGKPKAPVTIWYAREAADGFWFASRLASALIQAGWELTGFPNQLPLQPNHPLRRIDLPDTVVAGGQPMGVTIVGDAKEGDVDSNMKDGTPFKALTDALARGTNFAVFGSGGSIDNPVPMGTLRVVISPKADPIFNDAAPAAPVK